MKESKCGANFDKLIARAMTDKDLRDELKRDPKKVAMRFELSTDETSQLLRIEPQRIEELASEVEKALSNAVYEMCDGACK